jgi:hypothetical protein
MFYWFEMKRKLTKWKGDEGLGLQDLIGDPSIWLRSQRIKLELNILPTFGIREEIPHSIIFRIQSEISSISMKLMNQDFSFGLPSKAGVIDSKKKEISLTAKVGIWTIVLFGMTKSPTASSLSSEYLWDPLDCFNFQVRSLLHIQVFDFKTERLTLECLGQAVIYQFVVSARLKRVDEGQGTYVSFRQAFRYGICKKESKGIDSISSSHPFARKASSISLSSFSNIAGFFMTW